MNSNKKSQRRQRLKAGKSSKGNSYKIKINDVMPIKPSYVFPDPMPQSISVWGEWSYIGTALSTVAADFNFLRVKLNSVYDCGLTLTTNGVETILGYLTRYANFLVTDSSIQVDVVNTDVDAPLRLTVVPSMDDPGVSPLWTTDGPLLQAPFARSVIIGNANGFDKGTIRMTADVGKLAGVGRLNPSFYEFTGNTAGNASGQQDPISMGSWIVSAQAVSSTTENLDLVVSVKVCYRVTFYNAMAPNRSDVTTVNKLFESSDCIQRAKAYASMSTKRWPSSSSTKKAK
jgi:hypothetical protein